MIAPVRQGPRPNLEREVIATTAERVLPAADARAQFRLFDNALGADFSASAKQWLSDNRLLLALGGDGDRRRNLEIPDVATRWPGIEPLFSALPGFAIDVCFALGVPEFQVSWIECHAMVFEHGDRFQWHTDHYESSGLDWSETKRLAFAYYLQAEPQTFTGGELEFFDGTIVPTADDRLVILEPYQIHRVREVSCSSRDLMDGRWVLAGWIHAASPV